MFEFSLHFNKVSISIDNNEHLRIWNLKFISKVKIKNRVFKCISIVPSFLFLNATKVKHNLLQGITLFNILSMKNFSNAH